MEYRYLGRAGMRVSALCLGAERRANAATGSSQPDEIQLPGFRNCQQPAPQVAAAGNRIER